MASILLTGANSFTARHLLPLLATLDPGSALAGTDLGPSGPPGVSYLPADITDAPAVDRVFAAVRPSLVYHLAGVSTPDRKASFSVNRDGTCNVLRAAANLDPPPTLLLVSSAAVYGRILPEENPVREETPLRPAGPYGESKAAAEALALEADRAGLVPVVIVRPFNLIGPGLPRGLAPADFAAEALRVRRGEGDSVVRVGALSPRRDFVDVRDAVRAYALVASRPEARGRAFNVGTGNPTSIGDLLHAILSAAGVQARVETDPARLRSVEVEEMVADTRSLRALTGWAPGILLLESIREMTA